MRTRRSLLSHSAGTVEAVLRGRQIRKTPLVMTGIFLEILRGYFRTGSTQFRWTEETSESKVFIEPTHKLNFEEVQKRPALYVSRGDFQYGIDNRVGWNDQLSTDPTTGRTEFTVLVNCVMQVIPVAKKAGEVERLAEEASEALLVFKQLVREDFGFLRFDLAAIGQLGILQEDSETFTAPIAVRTQFQEVWTIRRMTPKVKRIILDMVTGIAGLCPPDPGPSYSSPGDFRDPCGLPSPCGPDLDPSEEIDPELGLGYGEGPYG